MEAADTRRRSCAVTALGIADGRSATWIARIHGYIKRGRVTMRRASGCGRDDAAARSLRDRLAPRRPSWTTVKSNQVNQLLLHPLVALSNTGL